MTTITTWIDDIKRLAGDDASEVSKQWLERAQQQAPYSVLPALLYLKHNGLKGNEDVLSRLAIAFPDRRALALVLGKDAGAMPTSIRPKCCPRRPTP
jgi:hypothetical protein